MGIVNLGELTAGSRRYYFYDQPPKLRVTASPLKLSATVSGSTLQLPLTYRDIEMLERGIFLTTGDSEVVQEVWANMPIKSDVAVRSADKYQG